MNVTIMAEELEAQAMNNRKRLMKSMIFGGEAESESYARPEAEAPVVRNAQQYQQQQYSQQTYTPPEGNASRAGYFDMPQNVRMPLVDDLKVEGSMPILSAFPTFRFEISQPEGAADLVIQKRAGPTRPINVTHVELQCTAEMQRLRDEMTRETLAYAERMKIVVNDEPIKFMNAHITEQLQVQTAAHMAPDISTRTEFLFPDGTAQGEFPS